MPPLPAIAPDSLMLVERLTGKGVALRIAHQLVAEHDAAEIERQLLALEHRRPRDAAATLLFAIRGEWSPPVSLLDYIARVEKKAASERVHRAQRTRDDAKAATLAQTRSEALKRLAMMSASERAALEARAFAEVRERTAHFFATGSPIFKKMVAAKLITSVTESDRTRVSA